MIGARHRRADALEIGRDFASDIAAVEIVETGIGQLIERRRKGGLLHHRAFRRHLAVVKEGLRETNRVIHFGQLVPRQRVLAAGHDITVAGLLDRRFEQDIGAESCRRAISPRPARRPSRRQHRARSAQQADRAPGSCRSRARDRSATFAFAPAGPGAMIARTRPLGSRTSQKPSPPIWFMCG